MSGGRIRGDVHVEIEQVTDRLGVLGAREPLERTPAGIRVRGGPPIHPRLERAAKILKGRFGGAARAGRRHHRAAQLADDLLGGVRLLVRARHVEVGEREAAGLAAIAMAADAILFQRLVCRLCGVRTHARGLSRRSGALRWCGRTRLRRLSRQGERRHPDSRACYEQSVHSTPRAPDGIGPGPEKSKQTSIKGDGPDVAQSQGRNA